MAWLRSSRLLDGLGLVLAVLAIAAGIFIFPDR